ncbi:MAG: hypothetical protein AABZ15_03295 [Nitrospirota bacterium]
MRLKRPVLFSFPAVSLLFIAAVLPFASGVLPTVQFTSERIDVHIYPDEIVVDGYYLYKNPFPFPVAQGFTIPFPIDKDHPEPVDVHVERRTPGKEDIRLRHLFGSTGFDVSFAAHEEAEIRVTYRQKAGGMSATYILKTTQPWGRPLERGVYTLYPHGAIIVSSNYPLDLPGKAPGFHKTGFMPDKDWQFTWRRKDG